MKTSTHSLTRSSMLCMLLMPFFLFLFSVQVHAQKVFASSQVNQVNGICLFCGVTDPNNAVGPNIDDFSTFNISLGLAGVSVEQTLIFPAPSNTGCDSLFIGVGSGNSVLSLSLFGAVTVQTFNGSTPNNDSRVLSADIVRLLQNNTRAEVHIRPTKQFDRVKVTLSGGLLGLLQNFRLYYANRETVTLPAPVITPNASSICSGDSVTLSVPVDTGATVIWYSSTTGVTGIHSGNTFKVSPSVSTTYAALYVRGGCSSALGFATVVVSQRPDFPVVAADTIPIFFKDIATLTALNAGINTVYWYDSPVGGTLLYIGNNFQVSPATTSTYYVDFASSNGCVTARKGVTVKVTPQTPCGTAPANPLAHYPLNGNGDDVTPNGNNGAVDGVTFAPDLICQQSGAFGGGSNKVSLPATAFPTPEVSVSTWFTVNSVSVVNPLVNGGYSVLGDRRGWILEVIANKLIFIVTANNTQAVAISTTNLAAFTWYHATATYDGTNIKLYLNGELVATEPFSGTIIYPPTADHFTLGQLDGGLTANLDGKLDEVYIYNRALSAQEAHNFFRSYTFSLTTTRESGARTMVSPSVAPASKIEALQVYPNPSTGLIIISGEKALKGGVVTVTDLQGRQVYRQALQSNSIQLPAGIPGGTYLIQVHTADKRRLATKIILNR
ncbi:T9SS type A sorting domain-containing protein [Chitinophaga pendula]|uniref:LamG-like jellyroll fold domain-containing protein n=1 Tax=Chitinophaga TaxID=79328 RepID=UPI000BB04F66|nr:MULTISPECIES: LamG-like jellyroll fold domain-containing protein [Chitinophaga]ASZ12358.1 hypothetical protein CK934_16010 [Chitinophaga sp. MD30]UCJ10048.1 T9SS type A sorting domain-containing protein [Chitinophaga pendula]